MIKNSGFFKTFHWLKSIAISLVILPASTCSVFAENLSPSLLYAEYTQRRNAEPSLPHLQYLSKSACTKAAKADKLSSSLKIENLKVLAEKINGDHAVVSVSGTLQSVLSPGIGMASRALGAQKSTLSEGTIFFVREDDAWKIEQENWLTEMGTKKSPSPTATGAAQKLGSYEWCWQASSAPFPQTPLAGVLAGTMFKPTQVSLEHGLRDRLLFQKGDLFEGTRIEIILGDALASQSNKKYIVGRNADSFNSPDINYSAPLQAGRTDTRSFTASDNYGMRLAFGQQNGDLLPGYIVLRLPYKQSYIQGYFYAKLTNIPHN